MVTYASQTCRAYSICVKSSPGSRESHEQAPSYVILCALEPVHASVSDLMFVDTVLARGGSDAHVRFIDVSGVLDMCEIEPGVAGIA